MQGNYEKYPQGLVALLTDAVDYELGPGQPNLRMKSTLVDLDLAQAFAPEAIKDSVMASACHSGLLLRHNFLDESHSISQNINNATGSLWHGIMHRRERDFSNAKYWFRQVGEHEIYLDLAVVAHRIEPSLFSSDGWDPYSFVDLCEATAIKVDGDSQMLRSVAHREWELLFDYCYRHAVGHA